MADAMDEFEEERRAPEQDEMQQLLSAMAADGSFGPTPVVYEVLKAAGRDATAWAKAIRESLPDSAKPDADVVVRTTTALLVLRDRFADREPLWRRAAAKAVRFLEQTTGRSAAEVRAWLKDLESKLLPTPA